MAEYYIRHCYGWEDEQKQFNLTRVFAMYCKDFAIPIIPFRNLRQPVRNFNSCYCTRRNKEWHGIVCNAVYFTIVLRDVVRVGWINFLLKCSRFRTALAVVEVFSLTSVTNLSTFRNILTKRLTAQVAANAVMAKCNYSTFVCGPLWWIRWMRS